MKALAWEGFTAPTVEPSSWQSSLETDDSAGDAMEEEAGQGPDSRAVQGQERGVAQGYDGGGSQGQGLAWFKSVLAAAQPLMQQGAFSGQDVANLVWGLAQLKV